MNAIQNNKLAMYRTVNCVLLRPNYKAIWEDIPAFATGQAALTAEIKSITDGHNGRRSGSTDAKAAARSAMCKAANVLAGQIAAYAAKSNNHALLTRADTSISILLGGRGEDSRDKCRDILEAAKENITALGDYGTKDGDPAKLQRLIEDFEILMPQPRMA